MSRTAVPTSPAELEEMLNDGRRLQNLLSNPRDFGQFITNYSRNVHQRDRRAARAPQPGTAWAALDSTTAPGAAADRLFGSPGEFFAAIHDRNTTVSAERTRTQLRQLSNAYSGDIPADGGFLVPEIARSELLRSALDVAIVRPRARVLPMASKQVPIPIIDETDRSTSAYGGVVTYWASEAEEVADSSPTFGSVTLNAEELAAYCEAPNTLVADSGPTFTALVGSTYGEAIGFGEDAAFINGDGVGKPLGYLNSTCLVEVAKETGQAADTITWENLAGMFARLAPESIFRSNWVANINTFRQLAEMAVPVGTGGGPVQLGGTAEAPTLYILSRPVLFTSRCPTLGDAGDISLADFSQYLIGDRQLMTAESSEHHLFGSHKTAFRISERVDGFPWPPSPIVPENGTATLSPFVALGERA